MTFNVKKVIKPPYIDTDDLSTLTSVLKNPGVYKAYDKEDLKDQLDNDRVISFGNLICFYYHASEEAAEPLNISLWKRAKFIWIEGEDYEISTNQDN